MLKRVLIPPLVPCALLILISIWVVFDETQSPPRMIDGRPDNAPRNAAAIILLATPIFYFVFGVLNLIDRVFDRFGRAASWCASIGLCGLLTAMLTKVFYVPGVDSSIWTGIVMAGVTAFFALLPMTLIRRLALSHSNAVSTIRPDDATTFEALFPQAGDAPKIKIAEAATSDRDKPLD